jgi:hypothetical protein
MPRVEQFELMLRASADLGRLDRAYDAELLVSTLLGSVYSVAGADRAQAVADFGTGLRRYLARRRDDDAVLLRTVLGALLPGTRRRTSRRTAPPWVRELGSAVPTGAYASFDEYGDQASYVATFAYPDGNAGGPEHALVALVDHNLGFVTDLMVTAPAEMVLARLREGPGLAAIGPARLRGEVERHLAATDGLSRLPASEPLATDRALATARLRRLPLPAAPAVPEPQPATERDALVERFLSAPEGQRLATARTTVSDRAGTCGLDRAGTFGLDLILRYAQTRPDRDALRWSPTAVDLFLLDWVPRNALLDRDDVTALPVVLSAWIRWSGRINGLTPAAVAGTLAAIASLRGEFADRVTTGTHRGPAARALAELLADGVDPADEAAVIRWLDAFNARVGG